VRGPGQPALAKAHFLTEDARLLEPAAQGPDGEYLGYSPIPTGTSCRSFLGTALG